MSEKIKDLTKKVAREIEGYLEDYGVRGLEVNIVDDDFIVKEENDIYSDYFYCRVNRSSFEVEDLKMKRKESLNRIIKCTEVIVNKLREHAKEFNDIFGVKLETIQDFRDNVVSLLDSAIDKRYLIGKKIIRNGWDKSYEEEYGILFNPSGFFSLEFEDEDLQRNGKSKMKCYIEFEKETISPEILGKFLCDIVDNNLDTLERYVEEGKEDK